MIIYILFLKEWGTNLKILNISTVKLLDRLTLQLRNVNWTTENIDEALNEFVQNEAIKFQEVAQPLRIALIGERSSPSIAAVMYLLGKPETLGRLEDVLFAKGK